MRAGGARGAHLRMFFAVRKKRTAAVKALLDNGAHLEAPVQNWANADSNQNSPHGNKLGALTEVVNKWHHTCFSLSPAEVLPVLQEAGNSMNQRRRQEDRSLSVTYIGTCVVSINK